MLARRTARITTTALLLALYMISMTLGSSMNSAHAAEVRGSWTRATTSHTSVTLDARPHGRYAAIATTSGYANRAISAVTATTTAYTRSGLKLWVIDKRFLPNQGLRTISYNRDSQRMRTGWIIQTCVNWITRVGPNKSICVKDRV